MWCEELKINWALRHVSRCRNIFTFAWAYCELRISEPIARARRTNRRKRSFFFSSFLFFYSTRRAISTGADDVYPIMHTPPSWPERDRRPAAPKNSSRSPIHKQSRDVIASLLSCTTAKGILERGSIDPRVIPSLHACVRARVEQTPFNWYIVARSENAISQPHPTVHRQKYTSRHRVHFANGRNCLRKLRRTGRMKTPLDFLAPNVSCHLSRPQNIATIKFLLERLYAAKALNLYLYIVSHIIS